MPFNPYGPYASFQLNRPPDPQNDPLDPYEQMRKLGFGYPGGSHTALPGWYVQDGRLIAPPGANSGFADSWARAPFGTGFVYQNPQNPEMRFWAPVSPNTPKSLNLQGNAAPAQYDYTNAGFSPGGPIPAPLLPYYDARGNMAPAQYDYTNKVAVGGAGSGTGTGSGSGAATGAGTKVSPKATYTDPLFDANGARVDQWKDAQGNQRSTNLYVDNAYYLLDYKTKLGVGFTDEFIARMKVDPIRFYMKAFQDEPFAASFRLGGEPSADLIKAAADAAYKDANFLPGATTRWVELHGNTEIPQEQWDKWWEMSQKGYDTDRQGNPYGVS